MKQTIKNAIKEIQCAGCVCGSDTSCYIKGSIGVGCDKHAAGTIIFPIVGPIFLGLPKGFNRLGEFNRMKLYIFETFDDFKKYDFEYDKYTIPVWKFLSKKGHTFIRGLQPRINEPFLHIVLTNCIDKIECLEITQSDIDGMD